MKKKRINMLLLFLLMLIHDFKMQSLMNFYNEMK